MLEVPVIASYPVYQTVVRQEPREQCHIQQVAKSSTNGQSAIPAILSTIIGGALGNVFDRMIYKAVPDFIDFHVGDFHWFIFNLSDIFISIGVVIMVFLEIFKNNKTTND